MQQPGQCCVTLRRLFPNGEISHDRSWTERYSDENQDKDHIVNVNRFHCIFPSPVWFCL
jgi:hypothetical protein